MFNSLIWKALFCGSLFCCHSKTETGRYEGGGEREREETEKEERDRTARENRNREIDRQRGGEREREEKERKIVKIYVLLKPFATYTLSTIFWKS